MQKNLKQPAQPSINIRNGPRYLRDIEQIIRDHRDVEQDVKDVMRDEIIPAVRADPIQPHTKGGGSPLIKTLYKKRIPNSSSDAGRSGGFRLLYHWDSHGKSITKLAIWPRKRNRNFPHRALIKLLKEAGIKP